MRKPRRAQPSARIPFSHADTHLSPILKDENKRTSFIRTVEIIIRHRRLDDLDWERLSELTEPDDGIRISISESALPNLAKVYNHSPRGLKGPLLRLLLLTYAEMKENDGERFKQYINSGFSLLDSSSGKSIKPSEPITEIVYFDDKSDNAILPDDESSVIEARSHHFVEAYE